jgi:hypothetical protein
LVYVWLAPASGVIDKINKAGFDKNQWRVWSGDEKSPARQFSLYNFSLTGVYQNTNKWTWGLFSSQAA